MKYFLILDAGSGAGRALLIDEKGKIFAENYSEWSYKPDPAYPGSVIFDPDEFIGILIDVARRTVDQSQIDPNQIIGISSTSLREGVIFLDANGEELYCGPNFDGRASSEGKVLEENYGFTIYRKTGTYPPTYGYLARLLWFKKHNPEVYKKIKVILEMGGWLTYRLTGNCFAEPTLASASGAFSIFERKWAVEIINMLGINEECFPEIRKAGSIAGFVKKEIAERIGISSSTPVLVGGGDSQCAMLGMGCVSEGDTGIIAGTTTPIMQIQKRPIFDSRIRTWSNVSLLDNLWILESNSIVTGMAYRWVRDCMFPHSNFEDMDLLLKNTEPGSKGILAFLGSEIMDIKNYEGQWNGGFFFPVPNFEISREDFARAVIESNAYAARGNIEQLEKLSNEQIKDICLCGGQTASSNVLQIFSAVLNRPIKVYAGQRTALGAGMMAAAGLGLYESVEESIKQMVGSSTEIIPDRELACIYESYYIKWREQYKKIKNN